MIAQEPLIRIKTIKNIYNKEFSMSRQAVDATLVAVKEALGTNVVNPNVEEQIRKRAFQVLSGDSEAKTAQPQQVKPRPSILEGAPPEGINQAQKTAFESEGGAGGTSGGPSANPNVSRNTGAKSQVAAATNSGNTGPAGPGAGNL